MKTALWKQIEQKIEFWGEWVSVGSGYASKSPIVEIMEYGVRTGSGYDSMPDYDIDKLNQQVHKALRSVEIIDPRLFGIAYYEAAWHQEVTSPARTKMKTKQILELMQVSQKTYYNLKSQLYIYMLAKLDK